MDKVIVFGNGKVAEILSYYIEKSFEIVAYTVDGPYLNGSVFNQKPIIDFSILSDSFSPEDYKMLCAVGFTGMNGVRQSAYQRAKALGFSFVNYIDSRASLVGNVDIGENNIILDNVSVQPGVRIGTGNILWSNSTLAHGASIQDFNWVTSGTTIAGDASIGSRNFLGVNSSVGHEKKLADECFVSANSYVNNNLFDKQVVLSSSSEIIRMPSDKFIKFSGM